MKKVYTLCLLCCIWLKAAADNVPFSIINNLFDHTITTSLGLDRAPGLETVTVFAPTDATNHYSNGVVLAAFKGSLYCMWQSSQKDEDSEDTWVAYSRSTDNGQTWSAPMVLCPTLSNGYCTSGGWLATDERLIGYINVRTKDIANNGGYTQYVETTDGENWTEPQDVTMADGTLLNGIFEQDPHMLSDGRIIGAAHFQPGLKLCPIYTNDTTGRTGWKKGRFEYTDNGAQSKELEPSFFLQQDGTLVMVMRDQGGSYKMLAATSKDRGETWTKSVMTNMPDSRAKQCAGNLPDGTAYLVNNPINTNKPRTPLALTLSTDGKTFTKSWLLRAGDDLPNQRYSGKAKTLGYSYPKAMISDGWLYVSYSTNKDDVQYSRIPISQISLNTSDIELAIKGQENIIIEGRTLHISSSSKISYVEISDLSGKNKMHSNTSEEGISINLNNIPSGIYIVKVITGKGVQTRKIVLK